MPKAPVRIGTSGYSFDDWKGPFYPAKLARAKMLDYYTQFFNTVEINATYYRIPPARTFESMVERTGEKFDFIVKAHESATHKRRQFPTETAVYLEAIRPLIDSGRLKGILLQFPWSFRRTVENIDHIKACAESFDLLHLFVEFRHASWIRQDTFDLLKSLGLSYVSVDEPQLEQMVPPLAISTGKTGYVRFHGRNAEKWYSGNGSDRYDYLYTEEELREWIKKIDALRENAEIVYIFFNNCHQGQAVTNARQLLEMLDE